MQNSMTLARAFALTGLLVFAGCVSNPGGEIATSIDRTEGSTENIGSLTDVINQNPSDPDAYNVRGAALGRSGRYRDALNDFNRAIATPSRAS